MNELEREIAELIVQALSLEVRPEDIDPTAPLYGDEYGLDSIDMLEIAVAVSTRYGVELRSDDVESKNVFASLRALANHVANHVAEHRKQ